VVRPELTATGDSLYLDGGKGFLRMMRKPRITGTKGRPFTLVGETIDLLSKRKKIDRVLSLKEAEATSEDLDLKSDTIDLRVTDDLLQRAMAWGKSRARAVSPTQTIVADSIDVIMPGQRVKEMRALRQATADAVPDTAKFKTTERDRLSGDTIIAKFDSVIVRDSVKPRIKELVAIGKATSYQHLAARDTTCKMPSYNYVRGRIITVMFDSSGVKNVKVQDEDPTGGLLVEPDATCGGTKPVAAPAPKATNTAPTTPTRPPSNQERTDEMVFSTIGSARRRI
jgi:hypothetical protein